MPPLFVGWAAAHAAPREVRSLRLRGERRGGDAAPALGGDLTGPVPFPAPASAGRG